MNYRNIRAIYRHTPLVLLFAILVLHLVQFYHRNTGLRLINNIRPMLTDLMYLLYYILASAGVLVWITAAMYLFVTDRGSLKAWSYPWKIMCGCILYFLAMALLRYYFGYHF